MKLIKKTYLLTYIWLLPVLLLGSVFSFIIIEYIAYEEIDEFLSYEMERIKKYYAINEMLPENHQGMQLIPDTKTSTPVFSDTLILEEGDNEMVPYRTLKFSINHKGREFTIVLQHLMLGRDDVIQGTLIIVGGILLLIAILLFLIVNFTNRRIWKPFYKTLNILNRLEINKPVPEFGNSQIDEFKTLNLTLRALLKKILDDYRNKKEFSENVSHELQTHLAIIRANTDKLLNSDTLNEQNAISLNKIHSAALKLGHAQKSLFLLSQITNGEFRDALDIGGFINIRLSDKEFTIENSGIPYHGNTSRLIDRFEKGSNGNMGIGLSIVSQICDMYKFTLKYKISPEGIHKIAIIFNNL
jgi:signal transduction histidine kinase